MSLQDIGLHRDEAIKACKQSLDFFAAVCVEAIFKFKYPPIFLAIWQLLTEAAHETKGKKRLALGIPRGFGKTMICKLFVLYLIAFTDRKFILIVCNTASLAENFIADIADVLSSSNFIRIFGDYRYGLEKDTQELKKFTFRGREIILAGLGAGSSLRGLNIKYVRPDVIVMDDMQSREEAASELEAKKSLVWMLGTLMKASDNQRCLYIFIGNMYPFEGCILHKLRTNPAWISFVTGAILEDGESLWPELRSVTDILEELESDESLGHPEIFYSEVMNDVVAGSRSNVDFSKINVWTQPVTDAQAGFIIIDPSLGRRKSDKVAIGACLIIDGEPILVEVVHELLNPGTCVSTMFKLAVKHGISALVVEAVAYQASLSFWITFRMQQLGLTGFKVLEITPQGEAKNSRIISGLKQLTAARDRIWLTPATKSTVTHQITYFDPLKTNNTDDVLDVVAYLPRVIALHQHQLLRPWELESLPVNAAFSTDLELEF